VASAGSERKPPGLAWAVLANDKGRSGFGWFEAPPIAASFGCVQALPALFNAQQRWNELSVHNSQLTLIRTNSPK
jgi:hypothetical protein